jgi:carboxylesterase type B
MHRVLNTRPGKVRGRVSNGVHTFQGIPYAAPPFGAYRLQPPQPVAPWSGVRDALTYGPKAPQPPYPPAVALLLPELVGPGEDCLTLNIWSRDLGSAGQPVMVWIPGGGFAYHGTGASSWYDGSRFARDGIVCVTINYRVGADGFLALGDGDANCGLLDRATRPDASAGDLLAAMQSDWYVRIPAMRLADAHVKNAQGSPTYVYEFAWRSPQFDGRLGACHGLEIPFVFDALGNATEPLWGTDPPQQLADTMHAAWVAFATSGDCGWPQYDLSRRATMRFDTRSAVVDDPRSAERALWEGAR